MPAAVSAESRPTTALLKQRMRALFLQVPKGLAGDEERIHQMRVMGRRLRVALPLISSRPEGRRVLRAMGLLRQLTRIAGASRDFDVIAGLLHERLATESPRAEARILERRLKQTRRRSSQRMAETLMDLDIARLRRDLRRIVARQGEELFTVLVRVRQARDEAGVELESMFVELGERFDPEGLHRMRRRVRRLRYTAEISAALRNQESDAAPLLHELQEKLGAIHDSHVLAIWLAAQAQKAASAGQSALAAEARRHERFYVELSHRLHRELWNQKPLELVARALEAMGRARTAA